MHKMCKVVSFKNYENSFTTAKVMTKIKVAPINVDTVHIITLEKARDKLELEK